MSVMKKDLTPVAYTVDTVTIVNYAARVVIYDRSIGPIL
jgi:hypothetical protein